MILKNNINFILGFLLLLTIQSCKNEPKYPDRNPKSLQELREEKQAKEHSDSLISGQLAVKMKEVVAKAYDDTKLPKISNKGIITLSDGKTIEIPGFNDPKTNIFFVVRHAEKDTTSGTDDPGLTPEGAGRAEALVKIFKDVTLFRIGSTNKMRALKTIAPIQKAKGVPTDTYQKDIQNSYAEDLMTSTGRKILMVGHSNTIPELLNFMTKTKNYKTIDENDFSKFYVISSQAVGKSKVIELNY
jgi:2,3-bisphosphoglycerate-dependent phosphoglycerate mutase